MKKETTPITPNVKLLSLSGLDSILISANLSVMNTGNKIKSNPRNNLPTSGSKTPVVNKKKIAANVINVERSVILLTIFPQ